MTKRYSTPFTLQAKAQDAVDYDIVPGERYIRTDGSGTVRTSSINVTAYKKVGTERTVIVSARNYVGNRYKVQYRVDGGSWNACDRIDIPSGQFMALGYGVPASGFSAVSEDVELRLVDTLPDPDTVLKDGILIPVVHDGASGTKYQRRYKSTNSATAPDVITDSPSAWSATPTAISSVQRYRYVSERSSDDGGVTWGAWSPAVVDAYFAEDGRSISIKGSALGVIAWGCSLPSSGMAEGDTWLMNNDDADDYNTYVSGLWEGYAATLEDGYLVDGHLWVKERNAASSSLPRWKDTGVIQGPRGEDALVLTLSVTPDTVRLTRDHAGVVTVLPGNVTLSLVRSVGSNQQQLATVPVGYKLSRSTDGGTTWTDGVTLGSVDIQQLLGGGTVGQVLFALRSTSDTVADTCGVTALWEQHRMLIPAGEYTDKEYRLTANTTPLVHCHVSSSLSEYWYLVGDTNDRGAGASPRYAPPSDQYPAIWAQASEFEVVLTKMLFADFARFGGFVVVDSFFFSQYGTLLYNNNGTVQAIGVDGSNYEAMFGGKVPYAWFDDTDPMAADSPATGSYKFRPMKLVDAQSGEEWMCGGKVHASDSGMDIEGTLKVINGDSRMTLDGDGWLSFTASMGGMHAGWLMAPSYYNGVTISGFGVILDSSGAPHTDSGGNVLSETQFFMSATCMEFLRGRTGNLTRNEVMGIGGAYDGIFIAYTPTLPDTLPGGRDNNNLMTWYRQNCSSSQAAKSLHVTPEKISMSRNGRTTELTADGFVADGNLDEGNTGYVKVRGGDGGYVYLCFLGGILKGISSDVPGAPYNQALLGSV